MQKNIPRMNLITDFIIKNNVHLGIELLFKLNYCLFNKT